MAFPADPLDVTVQIDAGGWTDITSDTLARDDDAIVIQRGRMSEGSRSTPTSCALSIRNTGGTYSPRNPAGSLYGLIGRNTPLRVHTGAPHLGAGGGTSTASTSHAAPSVTATASGLLVCAWMSDEPINYTVPGSMTAGPAEVDGLLGTMRTAYETVSSGATGTRTATASASSGYASVSAVAHGASITVQESLSGVTAGTGLADSDVTLTTSASTQAGWWLLAVQGWIVQLNTPMPDAPYGDDGGWILLGESDTIDGSVSIYLRVRVWVRRIDTAGAQEVIFAGPVTQSSLDNLAALYVLSGVDDWNVRATVEVPSWPQRWDVTGNDVWVPLQAQGILRRLGQGASPLKSATRRAIGGTRGTAQSLAPFAYWPLEDGTDSDRAASGLPSGSPLLASGAITWSSVSIAGSAPLPDWSQSTGSLSGPVSGVTSGTAWGVACLVQFEQTGSWTALTIHVDGGPYQDLQLVLSGGVTVNGLNSSGSSTVLTSPATDFSDGAPHWFEINVSESGGSAFFELVVNGTQLDTSSTSGSSGQPTSLTVSPRSTSGTAALGHLGVWTSPVSYTYSDLVSPAIGGHAGETAGRRIERLCHEEGVAIHIVGDPDDTAAMGAQDTATLLNLIRECEEADGGILYEPREALGLAYRCSSSLYNQPVTLALTYGSAGEIAPPLEPEDDDRYTQNDVTASRRDGSSARYEVGSGPLSTQDPPNGVGRYDTSVTVNVQSDSQLLDQAAWRAHLGTWDEPRYPTVRVDLAALGANGKSSLARTASAVDMGDRFTTASPPVWLPPGSIDQHVAGGTEVIAPYTWDVRMVCSPAGPWQIATVDGDLRVAADGSTVAAGVTSSATSMLLASTVENRIWTQDAADFALDLRVGEERVTASAIDRSFVDPFTRTVAAGGWDGSWTISAGTASNFSVNGTQGLVAVSTVNVEQHATIDLSSNTQDLRLWCTLPVTPTGAPINWGVLLRYQDSNNYLWADAQVGTDSSITVRLIKRLAGAVTVYGTQVASTTHSTTVPRALRAEVNGLTFRARVWSTSGSEPDGWDITATDSAFPTGTRGGAICRLMTGNTNTTPVTFQFDNGSAAQPQLVTLSARAVNGISAAWPAGTEVDEWLPAVAPL